MWTRVVFDNKSHQQIYTDINGGAGSQPLQDTAAEWRAIGTDLDEVTAYVQTAIGTIASSRSGQSADAAMAGTAKILPWLDTAKQLATTAADQVQAQSEAFVQAKNSIQPVVARPDEDHDETGAVADFFDFLPGVHTAEEENTRLTQAEAEAARQAMRVYQETSQPNVEAAPTFAQPVSTLGDVAAPTARQVGVAGGGGAAQSIAGGGAGLAGTDTPAATATQYAGPTAPAGAGTPVAAAAGGGAAATGGGGVGGLLPGAGTAAAGYGSRPPSTTPGGFGRAGSSGRGVLGSVGGGRGGGGRLGDAAAGGYGAGGIGPRGGAGAGGSAGSGFGPRGGGVAGGGVAGGGVAGGGVAGGGGAASGPGSTAAAGAGGRGGVGMGPMMGATGAGRGGSEEREHRRPTWLVESDSSAIAGTLPAVLPAGGVIGENPQD